LCPGSWIAGYLFISTGPCALGSRVRSCLHEPARGYPPLCLVPSGFSRLMFGPSARVRDQTSPALEFTRNCIARLLTYVSSGMLVHSHCLVHESGHEFNHRSTSGRKKCVLHPLSYHIKRWRGCCDLCLRIASSPESLTPSPLLLFPSRSWPGPHYMYNQLASCTRSGTRRRDNR